MASFTTISAGTDLQNVSLVNELVNAYSERRQSIYQSVVPDIAVGTDIQASSFWYDMQDWVETYCGSFIDHRLVADGGQYNPVTGFTGLDGLNGYFPAFTLATFRTTAGLNASGFRRSTNNSTFLYGKIQAGDVLGPWLYEDLQKAFTALKWTTVRSPVAIATERERYSTRVSGYFCSDVLKTHNENWALGWRGGSTTLGYYIVLGSFVHTSGGVWQFESTRLRCSPTIDASYGFDQNVPTFCSSECEVYNTGTILSGYPFWDPDGYGIPDVWKWFRCGTLASASTPTRLAPVIGDFDTAPSTSPAPFLDGNCASPVVSKYNSFYGMSDFGWIFKWSFTYSN